MNLLPLQAPVCTLAITLPEYTGEHRVAVKKETKQFEPLEKRYGAALDAPLPDSIHPNVLKVYSVILSLIILQSFLHFREWAETGRDWLEHLNCPTRISVR